jgi:hypothetical protein
MAQKDYTVESVNVFEDLEGVGFSSRLLAGFSLDRLVRFLVQLGSDVEIVVKPRSRAMNRARVIVA